jgi:hypothetical protein
MNKISNHKKKKRQSEIKYVYDVADVRKGYNMIETKWKLDVSARVGIIYFKVNIPG